VYMIISSKFELQRILYPEPLIPSEWCGFA
jgi:hypothetical protein